MLSVPLPDPLWWVARRLRQFLIGLAMLVLAFGASSAQVAVTEGPASYPARPVAVVSTLTAQAGTAPTAQAGTAPTAGSVTAGVAARPADHAPGELRAAEPDPAGPAGGLAIAAVPVPQQPLALGSTRTAGHPAGTAGTAVSGQRAPPHS